MTRLLLLLRPPPKGALILIPFSVGSTGSPPRAHATTLPILLPTRVVRDTQLVDRLGPGYLGHTGGSIEGEEWRCYRMLI